MNQNDYFNFTFLLELFILVSPKPKQVDLESVCLSVFMYVAEAPAS